MDEMRREVLAKIMEESEIVFPVTGDCVKVKLDPIRRALVVTVPEGWISIVQGGGRAV